MAKQLVDTITAARKNMEGLLAQLEPLVEDTIIMQSKDGKAIEHLLDSVASFLPAGLGYELYLRLLEYYKTLDKAGADFYWKLYEDMTD